MQHWISYDWILWIQDWGADSWCSCKASVVNYWWRFHDFLPATCQHRCTFALQFGRKCLLILYLWIFVCMNECALCAWLVPVETRRVYQLPYNGVTVGCELPCGCHESNLDPLQKNYSISQNALYLLRFSQKSIELGFQSLKITNFSIFHEKSSTLSFIDC